SVPAPTKMPVARVGAPPVRGKGVYSHPFLRRFVAPTHFSSGLAISGPQAFTGERFMPRDITSKTTLENLKREAKRWLRTLRDNTGDSTHQARVRLEQALSSLPDAPSLRDVQRALAIEHGFDGWAALKQRLAHRDGTNGTPATLDAHLIDR